MFVDTFQLLASVYLYAKHKQKNYSIQNYRENEWLCFLSCSGVLAIGSIKYFLSLCGVGSFSFWWLRTVLADSQQRARSHLMSDMMTNNTGNQQ